ncbi:hypothetical protein LL240_09850 [Oceanimonas baumannii]|uniref:hypothetical protein n=1 Tax=Oceanimonas baumannii TaxID=129578 RepID=UPI001D19169C|nr:hypothetical protein [Oceanimonas baumannii]MCC4264757.1 hypothetical protein [Oceanimonas baumannii]
MRLSTIWNRVQKVVLLISVLVGAVAILPRAWDAVQILVLDDTARMIEYRLKSLSPDQYAEAIQAALSEEDVELALSLVTLAKQQDVELSAELLAELERQQGFWQTSARVGKDVWTGVSTGEANSMAGLSAAMVSDMAVIGDVRDLVNQARLWPEHDPVILALAGTGTVLTAATVTTMGGTAAARGGMSLIKVARKMGKLSEGLTTQISKISKDVINSKALQSFSDQAKSMNMSQLTSGRYWDELTEASQKIISRKKSAELVDAGGSIKNIGSNTSLKGALDALDKAGSVKELRRLEKVSDTLGDGFRGALKVLPDIGKSVYRLFSLLFSLLSSVVMALFWLAYSLWVAAKSLGGVNLKFRRFTLPWR